MAWDTQKQNKKTLLTTRPSKVRVRWYEHSKERSKDLLIFDEDDSSAASKMWGKTELYGSSSEGNCSLKINSLILQHDEEKLFPWMDQNTVESFHKENYDSFVQLHVTDQADKPEISILGVPRVEEQITVSCRVHHTCPSSPPKLSMGGALLNATHAPMQDGFWVTTIQHTFSVKEDEQTVTCKASFLGGQTSAAQINLNAQLYILYIFSYQDSSLSLGPLALTSLSYTDISGIHKDMLIDPEVADVTEGVATNFTCQVFHACRKEVPKISWNYEEMPETVVTKPNRGSGWITQSNVLFLASMEDHGKKLICTAKFPYGEFTASVVLHVQKFVPKIVDPFENDSRFFSYFYFDSVITALTRSCVVIPCTFELKDETTTRLRGLWYNSKGEYVFHTGQTNVLDNFKGRTKLLGNPDEKNCTLEIDDVQAHDNGPFCFHAEKGTDKYRFNHSCVFIVMRATPDKPVISDLPEELEPGKKYTITCSVTHTCPSHPPSITWSIPTKKVWVSHMETRAGQWKTTSTVTYIPTGYEPEEDLICTASFRGGKKQESATYLPVKRYEGLKMETIGPYILAPLCSVLLLCGIAVAAVVVCKKRARR
ncbi:hypothetical protein NFI96_016607 [Prochilodus magdalenae]|nr:hypothetical protein NFI96_016607 [Prochilodus magdalenae]